MFSTFLVMAWSLVPVVGKPPARLVATPSIGSAALIVKLGSKAFHEREAASKALDSLGGIALNDLRKAVTDKDPEIRRRAENLLATIERREETARLLTPKLVRIQAIDAPLSQVVADLTKQSGFAVCIDESALDKLSNQKVTLDTGDTSFWKALDALCREAGLAESSTPNVLPRRPGRGNTQRMQIIVQQRQAMYLSASSNGTTKFYLNPALKDAFHEVKRAPVSYAGALRCQIGNSSSSRIRMTRDEILLPIEVAAQPDAIWEQLLDFRIEHAIDENGRELLQTLPRASGNSMPVNRVVMGFGNGMVLNAAGGLDPIPEQAGWLRLKFRDEQPRKLARLSGTIVGQMRTPVQTLVAVDNIRAQAGKSFRTGYGECLDVLGVTELADGRVKLEIRLKEPPSMLVIPGNGRMAVRGNLLLGGQQAFFNRLGVRTDGALQADLRIKDANGRAINIGSDIQCSLAVDINMLACNVTMVIKPPRSTADIHTLEWHGQHSTTVDVPFHFTDVSLR